jgi:CubicO group peptidase (beta-lactamase class C family)
MTAPRGRWGALGVGFCLLAAACSDGGSTSATTQAPGQTTSTVGPASTSASTTTAPAASYDFSAAAPIVEAYLDENELNGAGLIIVDRDAGIVHEQYWGDFDEDRISFVASSSKMVTAGVLLHLQDEGLLDVDAPISEIVEWGALLPEVTPAQLVSNSSGLVGLVQGEGILPYLCQYSPVGTLQECAEAIATQASDDEKTVPPDTEFRYGGGQWQIAGAVAEVASGKSWAELIDEIYVEPCALETLGYNNHFLQFGSPAFSYPVGFDGDPASLDATENPNMEGGLYTNARDYAALLLMHLREGRCGDEVVLSPEALTVLHSDRIGPAYDGDAGGPSVGYGLGWWVDRTTGIIRDPGAYGSVPWLDLEDGYGAFLVIEATSEQGLALSNQLMEPIDTAIAAG